MTGNTKNLTRTIFERLAGCALPQWTEVEAATRTMRFGAGGHLFRTGDIHPYIYCVRNGLLKLVYDTQDGTEWVKGFVSEGGFFASAHALQPGGATTYSAIALEQASVDRVDYRALQRLAAAHLCWQKMLSDAFQLYGARKEMRERELLTLTAEQRYLNFVSANPGLQTRIPQKDLARYLGVTPVGLSRIKGRLKRRSPDQSLLG